MLFFPPELFLLGSRIDRKLNLGGTLLAHQALVQGQIDLYPEYTGTALTDVLKLVPAGAPAGVLRAVREEYRARWGVEWLDPLGFNNTFAMAIRGEDARREGIHNALRRRAPGPAAGSSGWGTSSSSGPTDCRGW